MVILCLPIFGWAFDNGTGTFLVLGAPVTLTFTILLALVSLLALH